MNGSQLARALADIISRRPDLERGFQEHLTKWVKSTLMKAPTLEVLREIRSAAGDAFVSWHLSGSTEKDIVTLAKKLDPHLTGLQSRAAAALRSHLLALADGEIEPSPKPAKAKLSKLTSKDGASPIDQVLKLSNSLQRRSELEKLSSSQLKAAIKDYDVNVGSLSRKPSKIEMIEHIQAAIAAGWPSPRSVLDDSKY